MFVFYFVSWTQSVNSSLWALKQKQQLPWHLGLHYLLKGEEEVINVVICVWKCVVTTKRIAKAKRIHHYDLSILPDKCPRRVNRDVVEAMVSTYRKIFDTQKPVFDGRKNLHSRTPLPIGKKTGKALSHFCHSRNF